MLLHIAGAAMNRWLFGGVSTRTFLLLFYATHPRKSGCKSEWACCLECWQWQVSYRIISYYQYIISYHMYAYAVKLFVSVSTHPPLTSTRAACMAGPSPSATSYFAFDVGFRYTSSSIFTYMYIYILYVFMCVCVYVTGTGQLRLSGV